jgi:hypothetical protein
MSHHTEPAASPDTAPQNENRFHTYVTHQIPWYIRVMWVGFWIGLVWYLVAYAIPNAKNYF